MNRSIVCPLCSSSELAELPTLDSKRYWKCIRCDLFFLLPEQRLTPVEERLRYLNHKNHPKDVGYRMFLSRLLSQLLPKLPPGSFGLDYGCGPGPTLSDLFQERGFPMAIYDPFFFPDVRPLDRQYDFVTCTETIEHFYHPNREFEKLDGLVKEGGWLGIMTGILESDAHFATWYYRRDPTHVCFYKQETLVWIGNRYQWEVFHPAPNIVLFQKKRDSKGSSPRHQEADSHAYFRIEKG